MERVLRAVTNSMHKSPVNITFRKDGAHVQSFLVSEGDPRRCYPVTLVVGDDFHPFTVLHADA